MSNRLAGETSPYLLQHAHNPVDWYPWGDEAFARAREERKPILLSIGYSACHWCHVMERESFENPDIAALMNELFVNIKVDREERPDVDDVYMKAVQLLTGRGGWPLTVFLTPDRQPFHGGTYFPPDRPPRHARVPAGPAGRRAKRIGTGPTTSTRAVGSADDRRLEAGGARAAGGSARPDPPAARRRRPPASRRPHRRRARRRAQVPSHPGLPAPAAPAPAERPARTSSTPCSLTCARMAAGGVYDQIGGGFHRYSVDARWLVPHFEKMLYDNAQLPRLYLEAFQVTGESEPCAGSWRRRSTTCCARCATSAEDSSPRRTPTARARRASSSSGRPAEVAAHGRSRRRGPRLPLLGRHGRGELRGSEHRRT